MKKAYKQIMDALRMAHKLDSGMLPTIIASSVLKAGIPFIAVLLSAFALDRMSERAEFAQIIWTVFGGILLIFAINLLTGWLDKYKDSRYMASYWRWENLTGEKSLSLDYPQLEDPKITKLREKMKNDRSWGSGIANTYWFFGSVIGALSGLIFSAVILIPLFLNPVFYRSRISAVFCLGAAVITIGVLIYKFAIEKRRLQEYMDSDPEAWRPAQYFVWSGFDYRFGKDIRIYHAQSLIRGSIEDPEYKKRAVAEMARVSRANGVGGALSGLSEALIMGGSYLFVALLAAGGGLTVGMVVRLAAGLFQLTQGLSELLIQLSDFSADTQRLQSKFEYLAVPDLLYKGSLTTEKRADNEYELEFHNVSFKYPGSDAYALRNFSLKLNIGERLAVVGMNGSGKTTMIKLLCRLYDPTEGEITLNGIDIRKYDYAEYMGLFSVVFQDFALFSFPVGQNVAASAEVDAERAETCLEKAGFGDRLKEMPEGLSTCLYKDFSEDGVEISGGEAQKIALARALYKDAPFIILDEPTAALDPIAEYEIYSKFDGIVGGKTAIYISHRLSSCRFCHDIAVFHGGELIQRGSHDELILDKSGKYYELWNAQAQYYTDTEAARA